MTGCNNNGANSGKGNEEKEKTLTVGYTGFCQKFSPFTAQLQCDSDVVDMTQLYLLTTDRAGNIIKSGIDGETTEYNGKEYTYYGPADLDWSYNKNENVTTYTAKLRDDLVFSDGEPVTADDLIFSYYVYLDPSYNGTRMLNSFNVVGLINYQMNSSAAEGIEIDKKDVKECMKHPTKKIRREIEDYVGQVLADEMKWCEDNYKEKEFDSAVEMFIDYYNTKEDYAETEREKVLEDIKAQYGDDYKKLAVHYNGEEDYFDENVYQLVYDELYKKSVKDADGEEVPKIEGIKRVDDYTIQIKTTGFEASAAYTLFGIPIVPLHYYGDLDNYDYTANHFGFQRGDVSEVLKKSKKPLGAGPYVFKQYKDKTVSFEANTQYYRGEAKIKEVKFATLSDKELVAAVKQGTVDCGDIMGSAACLQEVKNSNSNRENTGDVITTVAVDSMLYGYIGINADRVCVDTNAASARSKALRNAFMTLFSVYREEAVKNYYGDAATVIEYPINNESWAAPKKEDGEYSTAFSIDVNNDELYHKNMYAKERYEKALSAAKNFFKKAGYNYDEATGKFTDAPYGAKMSYTIYIPGDGVGEHPLYDLLCNAKKDLEKIGIELIISDEKNDEVLWDKLDEGKADMWCAAWENDIDPDMYAKYHSNNIEGKAGSSNQNNFHLIDHNLDKLLLSARKSDDQDYRRAIYKKCMEIIRDWAVELPAYQRQNCTIFSTKRIDMDTMIPDVTACYGWMKEIHELEMK